jgi:hypothetical protein
MALTPRDVIILDLETSRSPDDCRLCGKDRTQHMPGVLVCPTPDRLAVDPANVYQPLGWDNKPALGLSLGAYYSYTQQALTLFDVHSLEATLQHFVSTAPFLVSFNGLGFDFVLMRGLLRQEASALFLAGTPEESARARALVTLCDHFKGLCLTSYDLLQAIWDSDPGSRRVRGLNGLDALCDANSIPGKRQDSATIPQHWKEGQIALVANHCMGDVYATKALFEVALSTGSLARHNGTRVVLPRPPGLPEWFVWQLRPREVLDSDAADMAAFLAEERTP